MSLGVVIKGAEGIVLAADSRVTVTAKMAGGQSLMVNFDNASKLLTFSEPHAYVAAVTFGAAVIGQRTAHSYIPEIEVGLGKERKTVREYAEHLSEFFGARWAENYAPGGAVPPDGGIQFIVGGFDNPETAYGSVFVFGVPLAPDPIQRNAADFGMTWGGQLNIAARLVFGYDPIIMGVIAERFDITDQAELEQLGNDFKRRVGFQIPFQVLPLQDCVDLATFLLGATVTTQNLGIGVRGVGGTIEVAYVTRNTPVRWLRRKRLKSSDARAGGQQEREQSDDR
jgi:hypothetical protein